VNAHKGAAVASAVALVLVAGGLLFRSTGDGPDAAAAPDPTPAPSVGVTAAADDDGTATTAASTSTPADVERLGVPLDPSGARRDRSKDGARQSAIDYLSTVKQRFMYLSRDAGLGLLEGWRAPGVPDSELLIGVEQFGRIRDALSAAGGQVWWVVSPLAVKVEAYEPDRARVAVWTATVMASGAAPGTDATVAVPSVNFRTGTVELVWTDEHGWSVWSASDAAGPVPMSAPGNPPSAPGEFLAALDGFGLVKEHR
jgi:hypothetical protein